MTRHDARDLARQRHLDARTYPLPWHRRLDPVLLLLAAVLITVVALVSHVGVRIGERRGWFDPPGLITAVPDERILENLRHGIADRPLTAATFHAPENRLYLAQDGGVLHSLDPATGVWHTEHPFAALIGIGGTIRALRSGCGTDSRSTFRDRCPDPLSLWALDREQALAHRDPDGHWSAVIGNTRFVGADGSPPQTGDLRLAAVSADGRWLLVDTRHHGIGLYQAREGRWVDPGTQVRDALRTTQIGHLRWWQGRFWLGGATGLAALDPDSQPLAVQRHAVLDGEVIDLDAGERLFVLERRPCDNGVKGCTRLSRLDAPDAAPVALVDEGNIFTDMELGRLGFAAQQGDILVLAGDIGLVTYDTGRHRWTRLHDKPLRTFLRQPDDARLVIGFADGKVLSLEQGAVAGVWELGTHTLRHLVAGPADQVFALDLEESVWRLAPGGESVQIHRLTRTSREPSRFNKALTSYDQILLLGPEGGARHDPVRRDYQDIDLNGAPWLQQSDAILLSARDHIFGFVPAGPDYQGKVAQFDLANGRIIETQRFATPLAGPITRLRDWGEAGIGLLDGSRRVWAMQPQTQQALTGPPAPDIVPAATRDALASGSRLHVLSNRGLRTYDLETRSWNDWQGGTIEDGDLREIADWQGTLYLRTAGQRLAKPAGTTPLVIGNLPGLGLADSELRAAVQDGAGNLYLAGSGRVVRYNPAARTRDGNWALPTGEEITLAGVVDQRPLALVGGRAYWGERPLDPDAGSVQALFSAEGWIWTQRDGPDGPYLRGVPGREGAEPACLMQRPLVRGSAIRAFDAREVRSGLIAVATTAGLRLYDRAARSWLETDIGSLPDESRLYRLGDRLALVTPGPTGEQLRLAALADVVAPPSCREGSLRLPWETVDARAVAVDEAQGAAAWIRTDGAVVTWSQGQQTQRLGAEEDGPPPADIRRLFDRDDAWYFTTGREIYRYGLTDHRWRRFDLDFAAPAPPAVEDIVLEPGKDGDLVTVTTSEGRVFTGTLSPRVARIPLQEVVLPPAQRFDATADDLLEVQDWGDGKWTFLLRDRIKRLDPKTRRWSDDERLPGPGEAYRYGTAAGLQMLTATDPDSGAQRWWLGEQRVPFSPGPGDRVTTAIDSDGNIWDLDRNTRRLRRCRLRQDGPRSGYECEDQEQALTITVGAIHGAYRLASERLLLLGSAGMQLLDPRARTLTQLPPQLAGLTDVESVRDYGGDLWLHSRSAGLVRLSSGTEGALSVTPYGPVDDVLVDDTDSLWTRMPDGKHRLWRDGDLVAPPAPTVTGELLLMDVNEGLGAVALDTGGNLYRWKGTQWSGGQRLPPNLEPSTVKRVFTGSDGGYWLASGSRLSHLRALTCPAEPPESGTGDCLEEAASVSMTEPLQWLRDDQSSVRVKTASGKGFIIATSGTCRLRKTDLPPPPRRLAADVWTDYRERLIQLPDGTAAFDPITDLSIDPGTGNLTGTRASGADRLAGRSAVAMTPAKALDAGWLRWDRAAGQFELQTPAGPSALPKQAAIRDRQLIWEDVAAVVQRQGTLWSANRFGVTRYPGDSLALDNPNLRFVATELPGRIVAAHGRLLADGRSFSLEREALEPDDHEVHEYRRDQLRVREDSRRQEFSAWIETPAGPVPAWSGDRFRWDRRRDLAWHGHNLVLLSEAGIHPVTEIGGFATECDANALAVDAAVEGRAEGLLWLTSGGHWCRFENDAWAATSDGPARSWTAVADPVMAWRVEDGRLHVDLPGSPKPPDPLRTGAGGLYLTTDRLLAAGAHEDRLYLMTTSALERGNRSAVVSRSGERFATLPGTTRLDALLTGTGRHLYARTAAALHRWDDSRTRFLIEPEGTDPYLDRPLAAAGPWRLVLRNGRPQSEVEMVDPIRGGSTWVPLHFGAQTLPLDVVAGIEVWRDSLYVASPLGLQVYDSHDALALANMKLYDLRATPSGPPAEVRELGIADGRHDRLLVIGPQRCLMHDGSRFAPCPRDTRLGRRWRGGSAFWSWSCGSGTVRGDYLLQDPAATIEVQISQGRISHDDLRDAIVCAGTAAELRRDGVAMVHAAQSWSLGVAPDSTDFSAQQPSGFVCVTTPSPLTERGVPVGLYLLTQQGVFRRQGTNWQRVDDGAMVAAIDDWNRSPSVYLRKRLRLVQEAAGGRPNFEQRDLAGRWHPLQWQDGRLALDAIRQLTWAGATFWSVTAEGMVPLVLDSKDGLTLDPDGLTVLREPAIGGKLCDVTDLAPDPDGIVMRCDGDSRRLFRGALSTDRDQGLLRPWNGPDPFANEQLVERPYWEWHLRERVAGRQGQLAFSLHGEQDALSGGRFHFDTLGSLALLRDDRLDLVTAPGGWWQAPPDSLNVQHLTRPQADRIDPGKVTAIAIRREADTSYLCMTLGSAGGKWIAADGTTGDLATCPDDLGHDTLWDYTRVADGLHMSSRGSDGPATERQLLDGRFTDDIVTGLPTPVASMDGAARYLVPTSAGLIRLGSDRGKTAALGITTPQGEPRRDLDAQYGAPDGEVDYAAAATLRQFPGGIALARLFPDAHTRIEAIEDGPGDSLRVLWSNGQVNGSRLLHRGTFEVEYENGYPMNAPRWPALVRRIPDAGRRATGFTVSLGEQAVILQELHDRPRRIAIAYGHTARPLAFAAADARLLIVEPNDVYQVDLARAALALYAQDRPPPPPPGPMPPTQAPPALPESPPTPDDTTLLHDGAKVRALQQLLQARGCDPKWVDGICGEYTRNAISDFQRARGLPVDGQPTQGLISILQREQRSDAGASPATDGNPSRPPNPECH